MARRTPRGASKHQSSLESRIRQGAIAECQVNVLLHEIDDTIGQVQRNLYGGV